jgi:HSP20 family protein
MTLTRWNPANDLFTLQREIDRVFNGLSSRRKHDEDFESAVWSPLADVHEDTDGFRISFDLPGMKREDIRINYSENTLKISGERRTVEEKKDVTSHRVERTFGKFYRSFTFPTAVDAEKIHANYQDGVLTVLVPKAEASKPKQISIN